MFSCPSCQRSYQRKSYFDRHMLICEIVCKTKKERELDNEERADTPSVRELYIIIMELATKCNHLEQKVNDMSKWVTKKKQAMKITDWLNATYTAAAAAAAAGKTNDDASSLDYYSWLAQINLKRDHLEYIFNEDYIGGMLQTLSKLLDETRILHAFTSKDNALYAYTVKDKWVLLDDIAFNKMLVVLDTQMMNEFVKWQNENKSKMTTSDDFAVTYAKNVKKIMGGNHTREQLFSRIKRELYKHIKVDPPNIMEYEVVY